MIKTYEEFLNEDISNIDKQFKKMVTKKLALIHSVESKGAIGDPYYSYQFMFKPRRYNKPSYITVNLNLNGTEISMINGGLRPQGTVEKRVIKDENFSKLMDEVNKTLISWLPNEDMKKHM